MLQADSLSKSFAGQTILDGVSFVVNKGERCALVGRNGCGKSTLFRILAAEQESDGGEIICPKDYRLGYLQQHLGFTQATVADEASLGLRDPDERYKAEALLSGLGFSEEQQQQSPSDFSGGYQLRLHLAKVLASEPDCLLLDEPTNYLDVVAIRWFTRFLKSWQGEALIISHDRQFLDAVSTHTMGIHRHKLIKTKGSTSAYYELLLAREEVYERTRQNREKKRSHLEKFVKRFGAKASKAAQAESRKKQLEKMPAVAKLNALQALDFCFAEADLPGKQLLKAWNLQFRYPGMDEPLIDNVSLEVLKGDRIAILGKNGRGKSTLLSLISGDLQQQEGKIKRSDNCKIAYFGQTNIDRLDSNRTIEETIFQANTELRQGEVRALCGLMMFPQEQMEKKIGVLSGGEKARVLLGKILATPCNLLLLDEPSNHLDIESVAALETAIELFTGGVVIVSHSEELLQRIPNKLIVCRQNEQQVILGNYNDFLAKGGWDDEPIAQSSASTRKEERRKRAELVQERARALKPLEKKISALEKTIEKLEAEITSAQEQLCDPNTDNIAELSRSIGKAQKQVDVHYQTLEELYSEHEILKQSFS